MSKDTLHYPETTLPYAHENGTNDKLEHGIKREMKSRHISMISIGGTIGTGLFIASGGTIATAGPLGALLAYAFMGFTVFCIMTALGEMSTLIPVSGSFNHYASRFVDPALGFALGWNYWLSWAVTISVELAAAGIIIAFWKEVMPSYLWSLVILALILIFNLFGGKGYGETEYWLSFTKIVTVFIFIIIGVLVASGAIGGTTYGFSNWSSPGAIRTDTKPSDAESLPTQDYEPGLNAFFNICATMVTVGFSYMGTELVGIAAGESANPRKAVPKAIRNVFWRILFFFLCTIFLMGLIIPYNDPTLLSGEDVTQAPFTTVFQRANIKSAADILNAVLLTVIISASNSALFCGSRTLMAMSREGKAPRILGWVNGRGVPIPALLVTSVFGLVVAAMQYYIPSETFAWVVSISSISGFISWAGIGFTHYRFRKAYVAQGRDVSRLPYKAWGFPFSSLFGGSVCAIIAITNVAVAIWPVWSLEEFFKCALTLAIFIVLFVSYKLIKRTRMVPLLECDFDTGVRWSDIAHEQDTYVKRPRTPMGMVKSCFGQFFG
ncbi:hypothetical protein PhCBS80983_g05405 [Powellomyces hirtus]|uniref:Amino acid permease/ SLC12A domain-containing protein n=1 Tax=Powellomyces hirtus TaxID=109895 RepID=A0A507DVX7_9FUNG|nr:hypothetical protein PhCBS80983_g05405 [Powellomyces hirtus]